jgi:Bacterial Ig domain/Cellulose binding domain/Calx-beta domain
MLRRIHTWLSRYAPSHKNHTTPARRGLRRTSLLGAESLEARELLAADVTPAYHVDTSWNSGFQAAITLTNHDQAILEDWVLEFDMAAKITSIWNAKVVEQTGNHYVISGAVWDADLLPGGAVSFGFVASASAPAMPANYVINGSTVGTPTPTLPKLSIGDATLVEGNSSSTNAAFTVRLSAASSSPVTVAYNTSAGTATAGTDFTTASGTLTFAPGQTSAILSVAVLGDTTVEDDETFYVDLISSTGATIDDDRASGTITNDDVAPAPSGGFQFNVSSDWGSGFTGGIAVTNSGSTTIADWQLSFDFAGSIASIWNAQIVSHSGNHYVVKNAGYNSTLAAGASTSFGFVGSRANASVVPANFVLSGTSGPVTPPTTNHPPQAVNDFGFTTTGQALTLNVLSNDTDADGDSLAVTAITQPANGTVVLNADSTVRYTPSANFTGADTFRYTIRDPAGATATGTVSITVSSVVESQWPAQVYAPYVDMGLWPTYDLVSAAQTTGLRYFTLAFIVADPNHEPSWAGYSEYALGTAYDTALRAQISQLRTMGGDVIVSFGGAANQELALVITDVPTLQAAYQSIIDAYSLTHIDFDVEGAATADKASIDRRNQAIAGLQQDAAAAGRELVVSYTLPVLPTGLTADGLYVVSSAIRYGVDLGVVNIMAMDYGDSAAPNPAGQMGDYAIQAANSLFNQLRSLYGASKTETQLWAMVGVTPMIGVNDVTTETFDQQEARELVAFAEQKGIGRISMWSLNRDQQNANGTLGYVDLKSSSILQDPFEFSLIFNAFTG